MDTRDGYVGTWVLGMGLKRANKSDENGWIDGTVAVDIFCCGE